MKIKGTQTTVNRVEVEIDFNSAFAAVQEDLLKRLGLPSGVWINDDGQIIDTIEHNGSHSSFEDRILINKPTTDQVNAIRAFEDLRKINILLAEVEWRKKFNLSK